MLYYYTQSSLKDFAPMEFRPQSIALTDGAVAASRTPEIAVIADRVGATASFLCAIHCVMLPFVLAALPLLGLGFLADHRFERIFVACAATLASFTILSAYRRHRKRHALFLMVPGIALLLSGILIDIEHHEWLHTVLVVSGGVLVAGAHVINLILTHRHVHTPDCGHVVAK
ncbi:MAG: MerC domain-containing protein [Rhodanobacteraceae bacterium]